MELTKRVVFTVCEDYSYIVKNTGIFTSINVSRLPDDLASRLFFIKKEGSLTTFANEDSFLASFKRMHPYLLDELLTIYSFVHKNIDYNQTAENRSVNFVTIGKLVAEYLYGKPQLFDDVVKRNDNYCLKHELAENKSVAAVHEYLQGKPGLVNTIQPLIHILDGSGGSVKGYPQNPATFSKELNDGIALLEKLGITVEVKTIKNQNSVHVFRNNNYVAPELEKESEFDKYFPELAASLKKEQSAVVNDDQA